MTQPGLGIIVFARMSSQRLPGKVLMDFGGRPLLAHILLRASALEVPIVVATSDGKDDDDVANLAKSCGIPAFRGSLDDVLQRAVDCADAHGFDAFARLCGDRPYFPQNPMRDALAAMSASFAEGLPADLISNHFPSSPPAGLTTEVVRVAALRRALEGGASGHHREHLTAYLYEHAAQFRIQSLTASFNGVSGQRFAVDTQQDYRLLDAIAHGLDDVNASHDTVANLMLAAVDAGVSDVASE